MLEMLRQSSDRPIIRYDVINDPQLTHFGADAALAGCQLTGFARCIPTPLALVHVLNNLFDDTRMTISLPRRAGAAILNQHRHPPMQHPLFARDRIPADPPKPHIVQPFWFGEPAYKGTGWYLRGLPLLAETNRLPEPPRGTDEWKKWSRIHRMSPGAERARLRSRSFPGMMGAAADQWGGWAIEQEQAA